VGYEILAAENGGDEHVSSRIAWRNGNKHRSSTGELNPGVKGNTFKQL
jgi:hypothetical protein